MNDIVSPENAAHDGSAVTVFFDFHRLQKLPSSYRDALRVLVGSNAETFGTLLWLWSDDGDCDASYRTFPRNHDWKALPIVGEAAVTHRFSDRVNRGGPHESRRHHFDPYVAGTRHVIVSSEMRDTSRLRKLLAIWDGRPAGQEVVLHFFDGVELVPAPAGYVATLRDRYRAEEHFIWNWHLNWVLLCSRALAKVSTDDGADRMAYESIAPSLGKSHNVIATPVAMAILYDLRRRGCVADGDDHQSEIRHRDPRPVRSLPFISCSDAGDRIDLRYSGTGAYPSVCADDLVFSPGSLHRTDAGWPLQFDSLHGILSSLRWWGLVILTETEELRLTSIGARFLDLIGPSLDDPDVFLRWIDPDTGFWAASAIPAIDRWLHKAFRAVKRRVSGLPAAPVVEMPKTVWPEWSERRFQVVHGRVKRISRKMLGDPRISEMIRQIDDASRALAFRERRFGIGRDSSCLGYDDTPFIFWAGAPVGVFCRRDISWRTVGTTDDVERNATSNLMLAEMHGTLFEGEWDSGLQLLAIEETTDTCERFNESSETIKRPDEWAATKEDSARRDARPAVYVVLPNGVMQR
ncbi:hypothetical protein G6L37_06980 [Agrobacterium rubi]|nr:hypothetical protein [Agrobacterium rubi]NTF25109.1 hypothetical protein [Agrobacterium rubi]